MPLEKYLITIGNSLSDTAKRAKRLVMRPSEITKKNMMENQANITTCQDNYGKYLFLHLINKDIFYEPKGSCCNS